MNGPKSAVRGMVDWWCLLHSAKQKNHMKYVWIEHTSFGCVYISMILRYTAGYKVMFMSCMALFKKTAMGEDMLFLLWHSNSGYEIKTTIHVYIFFWWCVPGKRWSEAVSTTTKLIWLCQWKKRECMDKQGRHWGSMYTHCVYALYPHIFIVFSQLL